MRRTLAWAAMLLVFAISSRALEPDQLLLIVNKNIPESKTLAQYYAEKRSIPDGRILELDLPNGEDISFDDYERKVRPVMRKFVADKQLTGKVACLVTFYGVPIRLLARTNTDADKAELAQLQDEYKLMPQQILGLVEKVETLVKEVEPGYSAGGDVTLSSLAVRNENATRMLAAHMLKIEPGPARQEWQQKVAQVVGPLSGSVPVAERRLVDLSRMGERLTPELRQQAAEIQAALGKVRAEFEALQLTRYDAASRAKLKQFVKSNFTPFDHAKLLASMSEYFAIDNTDAAFDSELALVGWSFHDRSNWVVNPAFYRARRQPNLQPIYMTMRIDGPTPGIARDLILGAMKAERDGLAGKVVVDAGGNLAINPTNPTYRAFDDTLKRFAEVVQSKTRLTLVFDEKKEVLPERSVKDVALYCGWYQLRSYKPFGQFSPGAIGYHVASYELASLRHPGETGWCKGLLTDGVSCTIGAVNEPYLNAFPEPDAFFPLLMTGRVTLAEAYWITNPMVSWRVAIIGDPLYTPYGMKPAIKIEDLPERLHGVFSDPATRPTTQPKPQ